MLGSDIENARDWGYGDQHQQYFSYIVAVSFIG